MDKHLFDIGDIVQLGFRGEPSLYSYEIVELVDSPVFGLFGYRTREWGMYLEDKDIWGIETRPRENDPSKEKNE